MPAISFMRVAVPVGCTHTKRLPGRSSAIAFMNPRTPHLVAQ